MKFALINTYPIPSGDPKRVNLGDGFILSASKRAFASHECVYTKSYWAPLSDFDVDTFNRCDFVVLAAANQLSPRFGVTRGTPAARIDEIKPPILAFGIGLHGEYDSNVPLSPDARASLRRIIGRAGKSSWRCTRTLSYLQGQLPELAGQMTYTSCPVLTHGNQGQVMGDFSLPPTLRRVLVTITDRGSSIGAELEMLTQLRSACPNCEFVLVLHQQLRGHGSWLENRRRRRYLARLESLGFRTVELADAASAMLLYRDFDAHVGSRLHAHLLFLSYGIPSLLMAVDGRSAGFAESLNFRLWSRTLGDPIEQIQTQAWPEIATAIAHARRAMNSFLDEPTENHK